jgi:ketosteroid isomerase-like protein
MNDNEDAVITANNDFYLAFNNSDMDKMEDIWSRQNEVSVVHPGWDLLTGRGEVLMSWRQILKNSTLNKISCDNVWVNRVGDVASVICIEQLDDVELVATNIFVREEGAWKLIHHHAGPLNHEYEQYDEESLVH